VADSNRAYTLFVAEVSPTAVENRLDLRGIVHSFSHGPSIDLLLNSGAELLNYLLC